MVPIIPVGIAVLVLAIFYANFLRAYNSPAVRKYHRIIQQGGLGVQAGEEAGRVTKPADDGMMFASFFGLFAVTATCLLYLINP